MRVLTFKADDDFIEKMHLTMIKLGIENRSELIRLGIQYIMNFAGNGNGVVCIKLSEQEYSFLKTISDDPLIALKKLIWVHIPDYTSGHRVESFSWIDNYCLGDVEIKCLNTGKKFTVSQMCVKDTIVCPHCKRKLGLSIEVNIGMRLVKQHGD
ncbi:hypothetical protein J7L13_01670 [bacterium]|nr:hypothetical protein [bacterium]